MGKLNKAMAVLLVFGLLTGAGAPAASAAAGGDDFDVFGSFVLPAGEVLDDDELSEVTGSFLPAVIGGAVGYVGAKLLDAAWERYVDPWLEETLWPWIDGILGR